MRVKAIAAVLAALVILCMLPRHTAVAAQEEAGLYLSTSDFLNTLGISFAEYIELVAELEEAGIYTYYLEKNASRYAQFMSSNPGMPESTAIAYVNTGADYDFYTNIQEIPEQALTGTSFLVNKYYRLPDGYVPDMVDLEPQRTAREETADSFNLMRSEMRDEGMNLTIISGYRSHSKQNNSYWSSANSSGVEYADRILARAGHSEHQTGLTVDFLHRYHSGKMADAEFEKTEEYVWLGENAHRFGFILRYPDGYEHLHGYMFEAWHWRYVGEEIATAMYNEGIIVYEEFYGKYLASDVLENATRVITDWRMQQETMELARLAELEAERQAQEDAAYAQDEIKKANEQQAVPLAEAVITDEGIAASVMPPDRVISEGLIQIAVILGTGAAVAGCRFAGGHKRRSEDFML